VKELFSSLAPEFEVYQLAEGTIYVDRPREVLREFDIFVLPSLWEGFGLSLAEAMAEGVPAIASDLPAIASFCRNGVDALLVPPGDAAAIYRALVTLLRDESLRFSLASSAYERVCQEFSIRVMAERYLDLYRELFDIVRGTPGCTPTRKR
jgi:glycosyltransferase involved in cell wall biosynthesis